MKAELGKTLSERKRDRRTARQLMRARMMWLCRTPRPPRKKKKEKKPSGEAERVWVPPAAVRPVTLGHSRSDAESYSQHSGTRRAHEAAHGDVGVSHPGLAALEAVFVYSGLGQLSDLTGADLLVVPVLSVRHFFF